MAADSPDRRRIFLSTLHPGRYDRRLALGVVVVSLLAFAATAPFAKTPLAPVPPFIPLHASALVVSDAVTAVLLFGTFGFTRSRSILILAAAYVFTALITIAHALSFPGLFAPMGLLGAGAQGTAWIYMFWHAGFPALVIAYALARQGWHSRVLVDVPLSRVVVATIAAVALVVAALTALATQGQILLPPIMAGHRYTSSMIGVVITVWGLSVAAVVVLWRSKPHTILDLWLMVVMCAWILDIALSAVLNAGRFDLGFYTGRIYGLMAATFVLAVLLVQNGMLYARLVQAYEGERRARGRMQAKSRELAAANLELDAFSYTVSHDLRGPLRHVQGYIELLRRDAGGPSSGNAGRYIGIIATSADEMGKLIDHLLAFSKMGRGEIEEVAVDMRPLIDACVAGLEAEARGREIDWRIGALPLTRGDPRLLRQVWANLLGNAVKYTRGRDRATIEIGSESREGDRAVFHVRDNGVGFDMAHARRLFTVFQRLHSAEEFEGTGVGLATAQRIVARHGGRIWAESKPGEGATFYFTVALERRAAQA